MRDEKLERKKCPLYFFYADPMCVPQSLDLKLEFQEKKS